MQQEILILGGSLAGMACAIELRRLGHAPLVLEKSHFPRPKLCGEFLGPDAIRALDALQVLDRVKALATSPITNTHFYNRQGKALKISMAWMDKAFPYGLALSRETLDFVLMEHARSLGVTVLEGQRVVSPLIRVEDNSLGQPYFQVKAVNVTREGQSENCQYHARYLVDATGRSGKLAVDNDRADAPFLKNPPVRNARIKKAKVGVQCHVRLKQKSVDLDLHMFLFAGGYGGLQPIVDDLANLCMLVDADLAKAMHLDFSEFVLRTVGLNPAARALLSDARREGDFCTTGDVNLAGEERHRQSQADASSILRVGDACVTVDPFTGSGMAHALETGMLAAQNIHAAIKNQWTDELLRVNFKRQYHRRYQKRLQWMSYLRPFVENGTAQQWVWPVLSPFLPWLAQGLR